MSVLKIDYRDLRDILTSAALHNHDRWRAEEKKKKPAPENIAYSKGMWEHCNSLLKMLDQEIRPLPDEIPLSAQSKEERFEVVREEKKERLFLDNLFDSALKKMREKKNA